MYWIPYTGEPKDWAEAAVLCVLAELSLRREVKLALDAIAQNVREDVVAELAEIVRDVAADARLGAANVLPC